jgi:hypothetical protein
MTTLLYPSSRLPATSDRRQASLGGLQDTKTVESTVGNTVAADLHGNYGRPGRSCMCTRGGVGLGCVASGGGVDWQGGRVASGLLNYVCMRTENSASKCAGLLLQQTFPDEGFGSLCINIMSVQIDKTGPPTAAGGGALYWPFLPFFGHPQQIRSDQISVKPWPLCQRSRENFRKSSTRAVYTCIHGRRVRARTQPWLHGKALETGDGAVRGLRAQECELRSAGGHKEDAVVWAVQPAARGCTARGECVRGLRAQECELWSAGGHKEDAVVWAVQPAARGCR